MVSVIARIASGAVFPDRHQAFEIILGGMRLEKDGHIQPEAHDRLPQEFRKGLRVPDMGMFPPGSHQFQQV